MTTDFGLVLLAAGRGTRFGPAPKLLSLLDGEPLVRHAARAALAARLGPVVAVLGAHGPAVRAALEGLDLTCIDNPAHGEGLSTSLRVGLDALPAADAILVLLGDMPRIGPHHLIALADAFAEGDPAAVVPLHDGQRGNPVLLDRRRLGADLATLAGDQGAGRLLARRTDVREVPMDRAVLQDVDTPEALAGL
ncbi:4-diphosphocytidyl-2C-methyl-D-erythritol kinase [Methylobacterium sp. Leaf87]|uniref:nucleotidyltransferase family protein n=1 Tax=Methylobacterium sp. Leaf87 TaxID=1736243 RepID=UPI0006FA48A3|nr:nucleotidyltransferase family protein [Methylobacterium sp. Leaf87]KQO73006.1 4-diphosphocytidyl-2C-methyl-D-erythritol kinase [Methylobacterium sp. Leaf87]